MHRLFLIGVIAAATSPSVPAEAGGSGGGVQIDFVALFQNSALVAVIVCLLFGVLWAKPSVDRIIADKEKAEEQRDQLLATTGKIVPVMGEAVTVLKEIGPQLGETKVVLEDVRSLLRDFDRSRR